MNVLILVKYLLKGGVTIYMYSVAKPLVKSGHQVSILSGGPTKEENTKSLLDRILYRELNHYKVKFPIFASSSLEGKLR